MSLDTECRHCHAEYDVLDEDPFGDTWVAVSLDNISVVDIRKGKVRVVLTHPDGTEERMGMREALEWGAHSVRSDVIAKRTAQPERAKLAFAALSLLLGEEEG